MSKIYSIQFRLAMLFVLGLAVGCSGGSSDSDSKQSDSDKKPITSRLNSVDAANANDDSATGSNNPRSRQDPSRNPGSSSAPAADTGSQVAAADDGFGGALFPDFDPTMVDPDEPDEEEVASASDEPAAESDSDPFDLGPDFFDGSDSETSESAMASTESANIPAKAIDLLPDAKRLFEEHLETDAINTLYAHYLVSDDSRKKYQLQWYPGLKEPRLLFRWGVGVIYKEPRDYSGRLPVIGDPGDENEGGGGNSQRGGGRGGRGAGGIVGASSGGLGGGGSRGTRTYKNVDTSRPDGFLLYYTGDFGAKLIGLLEERLTKEDHAYGMIYKDTVEAKLPESSSDVADRSTRQGNDGRSRSGRSSGFGGQGQSAGLSSVGRSSGPNRGGGNRRGSGTAGSNNNQDDIVPIDQAIIDKALGSGTAAPPDEELKGTIRPGVMLLGVGSKTELIERAKQHSLDSLFVFNVKVAKSRRSSRNQSGPSQYSTTSLKIIDLMDERNTNLYNSRALKDTDVQEKMDEGRDPVQQEVERAFTSVADEKFKASDLPSGLNPDNVKSRIGRLLQDRPENPLPVAVEIISFYESELLSEDLAIAAIKRLFGSEEATVLVGGTPAERLEFLRAWLPKDLSV